MTAKQPSYGPWIDWPGRTKKCPMPAGTRHQVRFQEGSIRSDDSPETWEWKHGKTYPEYNIVAYRVAK